MARRGRGGGWSTRVRLTILRWPRWLVSRARGLVARIQLRTLRRGRAHRHRSPAEPCCNECHVGHGAGQTANTPRQNRCRRSWRRSTWPGAAFCRALRCLPVLVESHDANPGWTLVRLVAGLQLDEHHAIRHEAFLAQFSCTRARLRRPHRSWTLARRGIPERNHNDDQDESDR